MKSEIAEGRVNTTHIHILCLPSAVISHSPEVSCVGDVPIGDHRLHVGGFSISGECDMQRAPATIELNLSKLLPTKQAGARLLVAD